MSRMKNTLDADSVREVVDQCLHRAPEAAGFRELLELACRHAAAQAVVTETAPTVQEPMAQEPRPQLAQAALGEAGILSENSSALSKSGAPAAYGLPSVLVGEVVETRHPERPGRVLVQWRDRERQTMTEWLLPERHLALRIGDRVLLALPEGWNEWIVTGALGGEPTPPQAPADHQREVTLEPGEVVRFVAHDGRPLVTVRQSAEGPLVELGEGNVELKAAQTLRLSGHKVEITASTGIDLRTEGDTVVRGRTIRLN
jgi:hypothetical protein